MKPIKRYYLDDGTMPDSHFLDIAERLVKSIKENPYSTKQRLWKDLLKECGEIMRFRHFGHFADKFNDQIRKENERT